MLCYVLKLHQCVATGLSLAFTRASMGAHKALQTLRDKVDLQHFCGYVTMLNASSQLASRKLSDASDERGESPFGFCGWNDRV